MATIGFGQFGLQRWIPTRVTTEHVERALGVPHQLATQGGAIGNQGQLRGR